MRKSPKPKRYYSINVKIPEPFIKIIDANLLDGKALSSEYVSRAHFVEMAVLEKLLKFNLVDEKLALDIKKRRE
ncbi:MAG: hypothetical protein NWE93_01610 [Candidatus Bathyarchaeota archaeon]|nr:hypothetical protein [Candidatus Bathyarchaeota archaeon]